MKKIAILLLSIIIGLCFISVAFAFESGGDKNKEVKGDGNENKGKYLYRKECRQCHKRNSEIGAPNLSPNSKTYAQWKEQFLKENYVELECGKEWEKRSEEELNDILTYLSKHARDSRNPTSCSDQ